MMRRVGLQVVILGLCALVPGLLAHAQVQAGRYPEKSVTIISDAGAGASVDVGTRIVAESLGKIWGQTATVVNHPGANGSIATRAASEATGDGYTLYTPASSTFIALSTVAPNLPVKLPRDFLPIGFLADQPLFLAVSPTSGIASVRELVDRAKKEPGTISVAVSGVGRMTHLTSIMLQQQGGIALIPVPYTGGPSAALADVFSGRVAMIIEGYAGIIGAVTAGQVKLIATTAAHRLAEFPDLPTVAETIPGVAASGWIAMAGPVGTPAPIVGKVSADLAKVVNDPDIKKRLAAIGSYTNAMTPQQTEAFVAKEQETWLPVLQHITKQ